MVDSFDEEHKEIQATGSRFDNLPSIRMEESSVFGSEEQFVDLVPQI